MSGDHGDRTGLIGMGPEQFREALAEAKKQGRKFVTVKRANGCCKFSGIVDPQENLGESLGLGGAPGFSIEELLVSHRGQQESIEGDEEGRRVSAILVGGYLGKLDPAVFTVRVEDVPVPFLDLADRIQLAAKEQGVGKEKMLELLSAVVAEHGLAPALLSKIRHPEPKNPAQAMFEEMRRLFEKKIKEVLGKNKPSEPAETQGTQPVPEAPKSEAAEDEIDFGAFKLNVPGSKNIMGGN